MCQQCFDRWDRSPVRRNWLSSITPNASFTKVTHLACLCTSGCLPLNTQTHTNSYFLFSFVSLLFPCCSLKCWITPARFRFVWRLLIMLNYSHCLAVVRCQAQGLHVCVYLYSMCVLYVSGWMWVQVSANMSFHITWKDLCIVSGTAVQWLALSPHSKRVRTHPSVWSLHVLPVWLRGFSLWTPASSDR